MARKWEPRQVWRCEKCDYTYESPIAVYEAYCPKTHPMKIVDGAALERKKPAKRAAKPKQEVKVPTKFSETALKRKSKEDILKEVERIISE